ncbi:MAG: nickel pincer cofactor biosynthesis protein LarC [Thermodesulfovibrionales bacterium]
MISAYFDCFAGISGDMCLGALVDAGIPLAELERGLKDLPLTGYSLSARKVQRNGISATKVDVALTGKGHGKAVRWEDISRIIKSSTLKSTVKQRGLHLFRLLFEAEAKVHGEPFDQVHLHELGGIDCMVDVFGTLTGLSLFGVEKVYASPVNLGSGTVKTDHGMLPVPAPATAELLKDFPVYPSEIPFELTTPTGAALLKGLDTEPALKPLFCISSIGYGAGNKDLSSLPNAVRLFIGGGIAASPSGTEAAVTVIETNIDDMNPQFYENVMDSLLAAGALDVFLENIIMKKSRPGVKLTVIAREQDVDRVAEVLFAETTTIGVRFHRTERRILEREIRELTTQWGTVRIKVSRHRGAVATVTPEYEDLKALSRKSGIPIRKIWEKIDSELERLRDSS